MLQAITTNTPTAELVIASQDVDCDGTGHAYMRVTAPRALVDAIANAHVNREGASREANRILAEVTKTGEFTEAKRREHDVWVRRNERAIHEGHALRNLLMNLLRDADNGPTLGYGDWFPLAPADAHQLARDIEALGGFDWDYWNEEGYYSYFVSR